jgi:hypothetical protein
MEDLNMTVASFVVAISFLPFFEAKNTAVNNLINQDPSVNANQIACQKPELLAREKCPACRATGILVLEEKDFGQFTAYRLDSPKKIRQKCPFCKGAKYIEAFYNPTELKLLVARERSRFEADHQAKGEVPVGEAFIPKADYDKLDRKTTKLLKETYGEPCRSCHWLGITACRDCDGRGHVKCPNKDCKDGWAVTKTESSYTKVSSGGSMSRNSYNRSGSSRRVTRKKTNVNVHLCEDCCGAGLLVCPDCSGKRALPCKKCNGLGTK